MAHPAPVISASDLSINRRKVVAQLLAPLAAKPPVDVRQVGPGVSSYSLGALPGRGGPPVGMNPEEPLVKMSIDGYHFNYHETWRERPDGDYEMERAYLHVHRFLGHGQPRMQVLSLHCDPTLSASDVHYAYKRGTHLHIGGADPAIERAHICLRLGDGSLGGHDLVAVTQAMREAIALIKSQFVPCWERSR